MRIDSRSPVARPIDALPLSGSTHRVLRSLKDYFRRRRLTARGVRVTTVCPTFTSGARSGVWTVCPDGLDANSIVYSFGVGNNLAWDLAMIERFGLAVHAFDPTPASMAWVEAQKLPSRLTFHPIGVAGHDGSITLTLAGSGSGMNYRPVANVKAQDATPFEAPVRRVQTLMRELNHPRIDLLKMDVEGAEYGVLDDLLATDIRPKQLLVEFHHHFPGIGLDRTVNAVEALAQAGYSIFHMSGRGLEMSFIRA